MSTFPLISKRETVMLNQKSSWLLCASIIGLLALPCSAAETSDVEKLTTTCIGCHGAQGNSGSSDFPNLAGQQAAYLVAQLKAFKEGRRKNSVCHAYHTCYCTCYSWWTGRWHPSQHFSKSSELSNYGVKR